MDGGAVTQLYERAGAGMALELGVRMSATAQEPCRACGAANPAGSHFCGGCGASLALEELCPGCGAENPAGQSFCNSCGVRLDGEPAADERSQNATRPEKDGERKQVTVLFADVKGSMDLAEQRRSRSSGSTIMQRFFSLLSDGVRRFEGTVDKFTGDGIMALFGAPIAHEDHAAPRLLRGPAHRRDLSPSYADELRRGHGAQLLGPDRDQLRRGRGRQRSAKTARLDYTAVGHTVGLAQRMEALAEPGRAYLTEHTGGLPSGYLELKRPGRVRGQGREPPDPASSSWSGVGPARSRLDLPRERAAVRASLDERQEMDALEEAFERAKQGRWRGDRDCCRAGCRARAGSATSSPSAAVPGACEVYEAQAQAHGEAIPFMPVLADAPRLFRDRASATPSVLAREKIAGRLLLLDAGLRRRSAADLRLPRRPRSRAARRRR